MEYQNKEKKAVSNLKRPWEDIGLFFSTVPKTAKATQDASCVMEIDNSD